MMMKKLIASIFMVYFLVGQCVSQSPYSTAGGVRLGFSNGITVKHFLSETMAIEGILSSRWRGFQITGLAEFGHHALSTAGLDFYYGAGAHIGFYNGYDGHPWGKKGESYSVLGVDGIIGIEYTFDFPLNISLDYKPSFNILGYSGFWGDELALSVRYVFN